MEDQLPAHQEYEGQSRDVGGKDKGGGATEIHARVPTTGECKPPSTDIHGQIPA